MITDKLKKNGHYVMFHDLYQEEFNPVIPAGELVSDQSDDKLVLLHQQEIREADGIIIIHPNWWGQLPAILKGWVDRVLRENVAYLFPPGDSGSGLPIGLLKAKAALVINTSNTPFEKMKSNIVIREINPEEIYKLEDMLYEAIYQPDENNPIKRDVLQIPEVNTYIKDFGKQNDDYCLVADAGGEIVGAVWVRILSGAIKGYGYVDNETPEFVISLIKGYRNQGIGARLMESMIDYLQEKGYKKTSLNVKKENYAVKLYLKVGFEIVDENEQDYLMLLDLKKRIALRFNDCVNNADLQGLSALMTNNHIFIDMANNRIEGKANNINKAWKPFFESFSVYRNIFQKIITQDSKVIMQGYSICSDECLNNVYAIWVAEVVKGKVSLWRIYPDNEKNRKMLGI